MIRVLNNIPIVLILVLISGTSLKAQKLEMGLNLMPGLVHSGGLEPGMNGMSVDLGYVHSLESGGLLRGSVETGFNGWGVQTLLVSAYRTRGKYTIEGALINGMALYRQGPEWIGGLQASWTGSFFTEGKNSLLLSAGIRFSMQPEYRETGPLWYYLDLPLRITRVRHRRKI